MTKQRLIFLHSDPLFTDLIIDNLFDYGLNFDFKTAVDLDNFLTLLSDFKPNLIFIEYQMSSFLTSDAVRIARTHHSLKPIIVVSKENNIEKERSCLKNGVSDYLSINSFYRLGVAVSNLLEVSQYRENVEKSNEVSDENSQSYNSLIGQATDALFKGNYEGDFTEVNQPAISLTGYSENELLASEKKFRTLFYEAPDPIFLLDERGIIVDCNSAYCRLMEGARNELINCHVTDFLLKEERHIFYKNFPVLKKEGKFEAEIALVTKKNRKIAVRRNISALYDDIGNFVGAISHSHDITERKRIQEQIKTREQQLSTLINASPDIICFKDSNSKWLMANGAILTLFQINEYDYVGKTNQEIASVSSIYRNYFMHCTETDEDAWDKKHTTITEERIPEENGYIKTIEVMKVPVFSADGSRKALVVLGRDITKRRSLETQLRHSHKMEAIGLMASGIAHNFNNILQSIVAYIDFAKDGLDVTSQRWEDIDQINKQVIRATLLTRSLLAVGKEQFMNITELDVNDLLLPIVEVTNRNNKNGIIIDYRPQMELPTIVADGGQIDQVIMNLFINARDAMPSGGKIKVSTQSVSITQDYCTANNWAKPGDYILISISDTGQGMDADTKRRIFEPYFTTKGLDKGTGLGLSTAFGIISQHKGLVNVTSELNKGTTFDIYLPYNNN